MCGIAGLMNFDAPPDAARALVERMGATIRHRGPDDAGAYADEHVAIGLQRLSVIDLAGGHQPMSTDDGQLHIVFNGEIYNYRDVRASLEAAGERFRTASDTEVILHQYRRHGLDGFHALNGMFAVAIWDRGRQALHLVRDRMGVKPLYYYWDGRRLAFASEIKALLAIPDVPREIEPQAIWDYLTFRYVPSPRTIWKHIWKLPPAHRLTMTVTAAAPQVSRWWDIPGGAADRRDDVELIGEFASLFTDAVRLRLIADVPVGITLSGGIDSSAVAAVAAQHQRGINTFSVSFADSPATDERHYARQVAQHLGTDHHEVVIDERAFLDFLPRFVYFTDEPLADLASVPLYYVSKLARESVTVALSGEGADEILAGYDFNRWLSSRMAAGAGDLRTDPVPPHMTNYMTSDEKRALFLAPATFSDSMDVVRGHMARAGARHPLDQMLFAYCQDWLVEDLLMKADRMSMATSLELRTPFLDYRLVEWAARAPLSAKVGDASTTTKRVLRTFAERLLPRAIIDRPKQGFPVPVYQWLSGSLRPMVSDMLLAPSSRVLAWFQRDAVAALVARGVADDAATHDRHRLWHLLILEQWLREWAPS